jgi:hypothetical protein
MNGNHVEHIRRMGMEGHFCNFTKKYLKFQEKSEYTQMEGGGGLDDAIVVLSVHNFEFAVNGRSDDGRLFLGHGVADGFLARYLDTRPVHQERVVQDHEVVVEHAQRVALEQHKENQNQFL